MDQYQSKPGFYKDFEPIALLDHFVKIIGYGFVRYAQVDFWEPIYPFQVIDLGALAAGVPTARTNLTNLELYADEFGQFRIWPEDYFQMRVFLPQGINRAQLRNLQVPISPDVLKDNPSLNTTELCVWEDQRPAVEAIGSGGGLTASRIMAKGYRFHTVKVETNDAVAMLKEGRKFTPVICTGLGASTNPVR